MENNLKSQDYISLESYFGKLKNKSNVSESISSIERIIKRNFDINCHVSIVDNDTNVFFGMNVYPQKGLIDKLVENIITNKAKIDALLELWRDNKEWYIELDSLLLYDKNLNANPSEIVAVMLHEIGHVVYSNSIPQKVNSIIRYQIMDLNYSTKHLIQYSKVMKLFSLTFIEACTTKNFHMINVDTEREADKFVVKNGYGDDLDNFIGKLLVCHGNSLINRNDKDIDKDIRSLVNWSIDNISELQFRKTKLKISLQAQLLQTPSKFLKSIIEDIKRSFFGNDTKDYKTMVAEQYLVQSCEKIVTESLFSLFDGLGKMKKINQCDIDILSIDIDKIENNDDKIYVLDLIYDKLDLVNIALDYIDKGQADKVPQSKQTLLSFKSQLEKMRKHTIDIQIKDKTYGLFIKYPRGYEG